MVIEIWKQFNNAYTYIMHIWFNNDIFSRMQIENKDRSMETEDAGDLQNEVENVIDWSILAELFDFWLKLQKLHVAHFLWMGYIYIRLMQLIW